MVKIFSWKDKVFKLKTHQAPDRRDENRRCLETVQQDKGNTTNVKWVRILHPAKTPRKSKTDIPRVYRLKTLTSQSLFSNVTVSPILGKKKKHKEKEKSRLSSGSGLAVTNTR